MTQATPPPLLALEHEIQHGQLKKVLLYHNTDRWYLGDFIRHATWLSSLSAIRPESLELATTAAYLPLYQDARVHKRIDVAHFDVSTFDTYDLVVIPSAYPPATFDSTIKRAIYTWDRGWAYVRYGSVIVSSDKHELNYFIAARHRSTQTALPASEVFPVQLSKGEHDAVSTALSKLFGKTKKVIVYNPTASNPFTRETSIKKEVDNQLSLSQHSVILRELQSRLPDHAFLVASALKPGDTLNEEMVSKLAQAGKPGITKSVFDLDLAGSTTMRGFASVLAAPQVVGMIGTGTGTNTHLASLVGLPAFSIERAADAAMVENWLHPEMFQMGSFRWRNPAPFVGTYNLDWAHITNAELANIAEAFVYHMHYASETYGELFTVPLEEMHHLAGALLDGLERKDIPDIASGITACLHAMTKGAAIHYGNFDDEVQYLSLQDTRLSDIRALDDLSNLPRDVTGAYSELVVRLVEHSNLHKLLVALAPQRQVRADDPAGSILKKIQVGRPLSKRELAMLHVEDEEQLAAHVNEELIRSRCADMAAARTYDVKSGWQHSVKLYDEVVVKSFSTNPLSEYLSDEYTRLGIDVALESGGGLIPHSVMDGDELISERLTLFVTKDLTVPLYGNRPQGEVAMPYGWVREQLERQIGRASRGIFNFDYTLSDTGINEQGVMQVVDFSVFRSVSKELLASDENRRTNVLRMGLGELVRNGQILSRFKNGQVLVEGYVSDIERALGIAIRPYIDGWEWGDHEKEMYDKDIEQLGQALMKFAAEQAKTSPSYGLVNNAATVVAYNLLKRRLGNRQVVPR
jgi:hypothetical protein